MPVPRLLLPMGFCRSAPRIRPASLSSALSGGHFEERINNFSLLSFPSYICDKNVQIYIYTFDKYISNINFVQIFLLLIIMNIVYIRYLLEYQKQCT
jgi:hypothetical protein